MIRTPKMIIIMGVSGAGKSTIGLLLAQELNWPFYEGDSFHSASNISKMAGGIPLSDDDRSMWLHDLRGLILGLIKTGRSAIITCSALKSSYRQLLQADQEEVQFIYLRGEYSLVKQRLQDRKGHFMPAGLLASQFEALEEPEDIPTFDVSHTPSAIVREIRAKLNI